MLVVGVVIGCDLGFCSLLLLLLLLLQHHTSTSTDHDAGVRMSRGELIDWKRGVLVSGRGRERTLDSVTWKLEVGRREIAHGEICKAWTVRIFSVRL